MKFVYTIINKKYLVSPTLSDILAIIASGRKPTKEDYEDKWVDIPIGGCFIPDDKTTLINLTDETLIRDNQDKINANLNYLASFLYVDPLEKSYAMTHQNEIKNDNNADKNYIGKWNTIIDELSNMYYVIVGNGIRKIIFTKPIDINKAADIYGVVTIIEDNGNMVYCDPEPGDILFDNIKEAKSYIKEQLDIFKPIHSK